MAETNQGTAGILIREEDLKGNCGRLNRKLQLIEEAVTRTATNAAVAKVTSLLPSATVVSTTATPVITSITPNQGDLGATVEVVITGTNFAPRIGVSIDNGGVEVLNTVYVSANSITTVFVISASAVAGPANVTVAIGNTRSAPITFMVGTVSGDVTPQAKNLLQNPGFEQDATAWDLHDAVVSESGQRSGSKCAAVPATTGDLEIEQPGIPITASTKYTVKAWIKVLAGLTANAHLEIDILAADGTLLSTIMPANTFVALTTTYSVAAGVIQTPASGDLPANTVATATFRFVIAPGASGTGNVYVDDCSFIESPGAAAGLDLNASGDIVPHLATPLTTIADAITVALQGITHAYLGPQAVESTNMAAGAVNAGNNAFAPGTYIFSNNCTFSRGAGNPLLSIQNGAMYLFGVADGSGGGGLTGYPYVALTNAAMLIATSLTGSSVYMSGSMITLYSVNGSGSYPYINLTSSGIWMVYGAFSSYITAAQIQMAYSGGASMTLSSAGLKFLNGTFSTVISSVNTTLYSVDGNMAWPYVQLGASGIVVSNGTLVPASLALGASGAVITNGGGASITLNSSGVALLSNGSTQTQVNGDSITTSTVNAGIIQLFVGSIAFPVLMFSTTATGGPVTPPATCYGFMKVSIGSTTYKFALYND